ncbi:hypothetical protein BDD12DRAFT_841822 [Trichophaea hybrida]|nr:hypothetical protein BDD12DRAFT_841822 [Trichophaea hybrida]
MKTRSSRAKEIEEQLERGVNDPDFFYADEISERDFESVTTVLKRYGYGRFDWAAETEAITARMTTPLHGAGCDLTQDIQQALTNNGVPFHLLTYRFEYNVALDVSENMHRRKKGPDAAFWASPPAGQPESRFPTLAIEIGYSESIDDLRDDARLLLNRSAGAIKVVVLVKYGYRADPQHLPADSYIEVWKMGAGGTPRRSVSRVLFPVPADADTQSITLDMDELFNGHRPVTSIRRRLQVRFDTLRKASERTVSRMQLHR